MQSQNSLKNIFSNLTKKQRLGIMLCVLFMIIFGILALSSKNGSSREAGKKTTVIDPVSGEAVNTIVGQNETFGEESVSPYLLGIDTLVKLGASSFQIESIKTAITKYSTDNKLNLKKASISVKELTVESTDFSTEKMTENQTITISAPLVLDDKKTIFLTFFYKTNDEIVIKLLDKKGGTSLYDSGYLFDVPLIGEEDDE